MNSEEFISVIKLVVRDAAIEDTVENLEHPPGRKVPNREREVSDWFINLSENDKGIVKDIITTSTDHALFGLLCVIDGVRAIQGGVNKGKLELVYKNGSEELLNDENKIGLHELYNCED